MTSNILFKKKENAIKTSKTIIFAQNEGQIRIPHMILHRFDVFRREEYHVIMDILKCVKNFVSKRWNVGPLPKEESPVYATTRGIEFQSSPFKFIPP